MFGKDYESKIFLTFDWDWAPNEVLQYTPDILTEENIAATFFVTHYTPLLDEIRAKHKNIELGSILISIFYWRAKTAETQFKFQRILKQSFVCLMETAIYL